MPKLKSRMGEIFVLPILSIVLAVMLSFAWCFGPASGLPLPGYSAAWAAAGGGAAVKALVEKDSVSLGEPFTMQIRVSGCDILPGTDPPDMTEVADFTVESLGGQSNSSSAITIINGRVDKVESQGYVYSFRLTPRKVGWLEIPSIVVPLDAGKEKTLRTEPVTIKVSEPKTSDDFHLELNFSKTTFYVGEPVSLNVVWYLAKDVESVTFNVPIFQDQAFAFVDAKADQDPKKQYFQLQIGGTNVLAEKGTLVYDGKPYTTLSFNRVFFARRPGSFEVPEATVLSKVLVGYSRQQTRRGPADNFFDDDFFDAGRKGVYKTFVTRSQPAVLTAMALPEEGKPADFSGLVGSFHVEASASPTEVSIGDPITLTVSVGDSEYPDLLELPPLAKDPQFDKDFKIPEEMASGITRGGVRQFTQTLRPKSSDVVAIPPISIPHFNPGSGRYEIAQSKAIPITVKAAKVLTSADVEGKSGDTAVKRNELESWSKGIAYNYEGPEVLERQRYRIAGIVRSPLWLTVTFIPFLSLLALLAFTRIRQKQLADPDGLRSRKAFAGFKQRVRAAGVERLPSGDACAVLLDALKAYLGDKLRNTGSALTFADVEGKLKERGISNQLTERVRILFEAYEQGSYGGMDLNHPVAELARETIDVVRSLERVI